MQQLDLKEVSRAAVGVRRMLRGVLICITILNRSVGMVRIAGIEKGFSPLCENYSIIGNYHAFLLLVVLANPSSRLPSQSCLIERRLARAGSL